MRLGSLLICVQLVLVLAALLHAAEVNKAACDHERSRTCREVLQQVKPDTSAHLYRLQELTKVRCDCCSMYCQWQQKQTIS